MTASLIVVALGALVAAVGTGALTARCARTPRAFLVAWTVALFGLAVALAAQALGYLAGFSGPVFRAMELGAQAIAPLALGLGLVELIARGLPGRFAMRLAVSAIGVIVLVVLGNDPLSTTTALSTSWPDPAVFYQLIPVGLIDFLAIFTIVVALASGLVVMARAGRGPAYADLVRPAFIAAAAAVIVAVPGVLMFAHIRFGSTAFALITVLAAVLLWLAAAAAARRGLAGDRQADDRDRRRPPADGGWYDPGRDEDDRYDGHDPADDYLTSAYRDETAYQRRRAASPGQRFGDPDADLSYPALAALAAERSDPDAGRYDSGQFDSGQFEPGQLDSGQFNSGQVEPGFDSGQFDSGQFDPGQFEPGQFEPDLPPGALEPGEQRVTGDRRGGPDPPAQMFGQITIYTLLDERLEEFDRMTEQVVEQVRSREPGTLVYIVHAVPTAPMQRILYEVYRDRTAYDEHLAQPYMIRYVAERRSMVLATNAIELGLQQAKVSPLPSYSAISDILSESGIDLTGVTRSARGVAAAPAGHYGRPEAPGPGRYEPPRPDQDEPGYEGWAALRDEDPRYR